MALDVLQSLAKQGAVRVAPRPAIVAHLDPHKCVDVVVAHPKEGRAPFESPLHNGSRVAYRPLLLGQRQDQSRWPMATILISFLGVHDCDHRMRGWFSVGRLTAQRDARIPSCLCGRPQDVRCCPIQVRRPRPTVRQHKDWPEDAAAKQLRLTDVLLANDRLAHLHEAQEASHCVRRSREPQPRRAAGGQQWPLNRSERARRWSLFVPTQCGGGLHTACALNVHAGDAWSLAERHPALHTYLLAADAVLPPAPRRLDVPVGALRLRS